MFCHCLLHTLSQLLVSIVKDVQYNSLLYHTNHNTSVICTHRLGNRYLVKLKLFCTVNPPTDVKMSVQSADESLVGLLYCTTLSLLYRFVTVLHFVILYCTVLYNITKDLDCSVLYCTVLYCTVLYCTVLHCTALYFTVLYCTVLYCRCGPPTSRWAGTWSSPALSASTCNSHAEARRCCSIQSI